ncbi:acyl-CoA thioesterase [Candidatus Bathyarchaeota archaeon]|nr:MAG: acyl-CoA thioesterase [Candidatus Bathyarchaeota archaeon]
MAIFKTTYRVMWSDIDAAQVVNHSNYFRFFQRAEEEFYEYLGLGPGFDYFTERGIWLPRIEVFCQYKAPSSFGDTLEVSLTIMEIKKKSVKYGFVVKKKDTGVLVAEGYVVATAADKRIEKAINFPSEIAKKLKAFKKCAHM